MIDRFFILEGQAQITSWIEKLNNNHLKGKITSVYAKLDRNGNLTKLNDWSTLTVHHFGLG